MGTLVQAIHWGMLSEETGEGVREVGWERERR